MPIVDGYLGLVPMSLPSPADAGHRVVFPGENRPAGGITMARGGTPEADEALGREAWPHILRALRSRSPTTIS